MRLAISTLLLATLLLPIGAMAGDVFTASTTEEALQQAEDKGGDRIVVAYLTQPSSPDCSWMDQETWAANSVQQWVRNHAVAVRMDIRFGQGSELASRNGLDQAPAVVAIKNGAVVNRRQGAMGAQTMLDWLEVVRVGQARAERILSEAGAPKVGPEGELDFETRMVVALELQGAGRRDLAGRELAGLWMLSMGTSQQETRRPLVAQAMKPLVQQDYDAKHHITLARDASWARYIKYKSLGDLVDWMTLNQMLGESNVTLQWVTLSRQTDEGKETLTRLLGHPQDPLMSLLVQQGMWVTIGRSIREPIRALDDRELVFRKNKVSITGHISDADRATHRRVQSIIAGALLAAGREKEGKATTEHVLTLDKKAGPSLVQTALEIGEPRRWHRALLNPSYENQVQIALELAKALREK